MAYRSRLSYQLDYESPNVCHDEQALFAGRWPTDAGMLLAASYGYDVWVPLKALGALVTSVTRQVWRQRSDYGAPAVSGLVFGLVPWLVVYLAVSAFLSQLLAIAAPAFVIQYIRAD